MKLDIKDINKNYRGMSLKALLGKMGHYWMPAISLVWRVFSQK